MIWQDPMPPFDANDDRENRITFLCLCILCLAASVFAATFPAIVEAIR
jgi:hypothetical protein